MCFSLFSGTWGDSIDVQTNDDADDRLLDVEDEEGNTSEDGQADTDQAVDDEDRRSPMAAITNTCASSIGRRRGCKRRRSEYLEDSAESDENARARKKRRKNKKHNN